MKRCARINPNHSRTFAARLFAAALRYVDVDSTNARPPYTIWATAATNIQDAVDASVAGDEIVITNGIYATDGSADTADPDGDHFDNYSEWRAGASASDATSLLKILPVSPSVNAATVTWQSVNGVHYVLERSTSLALPFTRAATGIPVDTNTTSWLDSGAGGEGPFFYRVGVEQ